MTGIVGRRPDGELWIGGLFDGAAIVAASLTGVPGAPGPGTTEKLTRSGSRSPRGGAYTRWKACGANSPTASMAIPAIPSAPPAKASAAMPVMTWAEASTMPIWKAADPSS
jgi:hypothetical protein